MPDPMRKSARVAASASNASRPQMLKAAKQELAGAKAHGGGAGTPRQQGVIRRMSSSLLSLGRVSSAGGKKPLPAVQKGLGDADAAKADKGSDSQDLTGAL